MIKILLIDDNPTIVRDMLTMFGYETDVAMDGFEGIQKLMDTKSDYDIVILDVHMPKMDGWAALKYIRNGEHRPNVPIIMLTSASEENSIIAGLRRGADEYLVKPIAPGKLLAHIEALTRRTQWESKAAEQLYDPEKEMMLGAFELLTSRERELLTYIAKGLSNSKIGDALSISETTVKNHLAHIFKKLNVSNRTEAAYVAQKLKVV